MYDTKWFLKRMRESHPNDYEEYVLCSKYINSHTKVTMYHNVCKTYFEITPNSFISGRGCNECHIQGRNKNNMLSIDEANSRMPEGVYIIPPYKGMIPLNTVHCTRCGETYEASPHGIIRRGHCTRCTDRYRRSTLEFSNELFHLSNGEYSLIGSYFGANKKVKIKHIKCGTIYEVTPHNFKHGRRCPKCSYSNGEIVVEKILNDNSIRYEHPKTFPDLMDKNKLHYDFYLSEYNLLIEYQGKQHYGSVKYFGGEQSYAKQKAHDEMKKKYAFDNGYSFIAIPYTCSNYEEIHAYINDKLINIGKPRV